MSNFGRHALGALDAAFGVLEHHVGLKGGGHRVHPGVGCPLQ
ncbi:hypothetical protein [Streptomyces sp. NPDC020607]